MNEFELKFNKMITKLAGNQFGKQMFDNQVESGIDYSKEIVIIFPERIDSIASSFIQGFFEKIVDNIGLSGIEEKIEIRSSIKDLKKIVIDNLL